MPFSSVRSDNGLSWAAMRPTCFSRSVPAILLALLVLGVWGCSSKEGRLLGNERLLRGPGGFGETGRAALNPDRDTYVSPGEANFGATLLVGTEGSFDSRAFFRIASWTLPDTTDPTLSITSITFEIPFDAEVSVPSTAFVVNFATTATAYDTLAAYPGPVTGLTLGSVDSILVAPFRIAIPPSIFSQIRGWAENPSSLPGLVLYGVGGSELIGLQAGKAVLKIGYDHTVSGNLERDTVSTAIPLDFALHSPGLPAPTGADSTLVLGGHNEWSVPLHFTPAAVAEGSTVNEATIRLRVAADSPVFLSNRTVDLEVRRIRGAWLESAGTLASISADSTVLVSKTRIAYTGPADSVITVALPQALIREWSAPGAINEGILLTVKNGYTNKEIRLKSRESTNPIELRVSITTPPPGRF